MDLDFDDQPLDRAAPAARAGARFKPKGRPQPKKKQVSLSTSQTTDLPKEKLAIQSEDSVSLDGSSSKDSTSETIDLTKEKISTQSEEDSTLETIVPESGTINESTSGPLSEENVDVFSRGVNWKPSILRACTNVVLEGKRRDDDIEAAPALHDDLRTQDSAVEDLVTPAMVLDGKRRDDDIEAAPALHDDLRTQDSAVEDSFTPATDENIHAETKRMETVEEECHLDMETLDIVQEEGMSNAYEQHTGKFQPKPRLLDPVIEEPESHYYVDDTGNFTMGTSDSEPMVNVESRNDFSNNTTFYGETQEVELNIPEVPRETVPEEARNAYGGWEHEEQGTNNTVIGEEESGLGNTVEAEQSGKKSEKGKSKKATTRKRKTASEKESNKSTEVPEKKKFKHTSRRQKKTLDKTLINTPDDEIRFLPIRDMLLVAQYREKLEKKEAKGAPVVPPTQESNTNTSYNQYDSQDFDFDDEFAMEEGENQEATVIKPEAPVNYQTHMKKTPRTRWSKEDTELFYEGIQEFGSNLSMVAHLFPDRTRQQIKLKFKLEERRYPLKLNDALASRSKDLTHFKNVIKKLQEEAAAAKKAEDEEEGFEDEDGEEAEAETTTDVPDNEEPAKTEERVGDGVTGVKKSDGGDIENDVELDGGDECDDDFWNSYKSDM